MAKSSGSFGIKPKSAVNPGSGGSPAVKPSAVKGLGATNSSGFGNPKTVNMNVKSSKLPIPQSVANPGDAPGKWASKKNSTFTL